MISLYKSWLKEKPQRFGELMSLVAVLYFPHLLPKSLLSSFNYSQNCFLLEQPLNERSGLWAGSAMDTSGHKEWGLYLPIVCVLDLQENNFGNSLVIPPVFVVSEKTVFLPKYICEHVL